MGKVFPKQSRKTLQKHLGTVLIPKTNYFYRMAIQFKIGKKANRAFDAIGCKLFAIPTQSPEVNPIENIFNRIREKLTEDAITHQIKQERVFYSCKKNFRRVFS